MKHLVLIAHNLRSCHNVGSLLRTAEGLGVEAVWLTGYTPYPQQEKDDRLPHISSKLTKQIHKTALGAENTQVWYHNASINDVLKHLKHFGYTIAAVEQHQKSELLPHYAAPERLAIIVGREVEGVEPELLKACDAILEIPMSGDKESFNVAVAAAMALYHLKFAS
jgi:23S rRNA (guanosine2251-2'-O)-methyltransferase